MNTDILILIGTVLLSYGIAYFLPKNMTWVKPILVIGAGYLLSIICLEIFPEIYQSQIELIGIWIILGVGVQLFGEILTKGIEHGHLHHAQLSTSLVIGLFLHAFFEGLPTAHSHSHLIWAIVLHKIPIAILLYIMVSQLKISVFQKVLVLVTFALITPLGQWVGNYFEDLHPYFLALTAGIFLHISSVIIFESNTGHTFQMKKLLFLVMGVLLGLISVILI